ncbi:MAG: protein kinase [Acidobacteriota bacterium]|nr:protein kinase [Acidobacteriota bacterium]
MDRAFQPGESLLHYRLTEKIGEGGMGVVWKALDTKLDRDVAIKILPAVFSQDPERLSRFKREAKILASVNHPAVAAIYGFETVGETHFLVLELVPGQGLDELLKSGPLPVKRALEIARGVAEGLQAAHATDIIHRDLKPANVKVTGGQRGQTSSLSPNATVKVLDFGLARAGEAPTSPVDSSLSPTVTSAGTQFGMILGTAAYMSPEQARGLPTDRRTDIWSFGCLLYECLTDSRPFAGETVSDSIARILEREPDLDALPADTPGQVRSLLTRCLEKDRDQRLADIGDVIAAIDEGLKNPTPAPSVRRRSVSIAIPVIIAVVAGFWILFDDDKPAPSPVVQEATKQMMAVLPFDNMGPAEDEYFAEGITEEISARLASIDQLGIIGRTSAAQYKDSDKTMQQIGDELSIEYVLDGTVRWQRTGDGSRVRVTPQLIRVSDASQIWTEIYEAEMSDIFEVQSDIAGKVAQALNLALGGTTDTRPTDNVDAYDFYLRGREFANDSFDDSKLRFGIQMFEKAVALDPEFALAYAEMGIAHQGLYWFFHDRSLERLELARAAVETALRLDPDLPQAHLAQGWYRYHGFLDYEGALESFAIAEAGMPDNVDVMGAIGAVKRRQGKWDEALDWFQRSIEIDPRSPGVWKSMQDTTLAMRMYPEALEAIDRIIDLTPDDGTAYIAKAIIHFSWKGDIDAAFATLDGALGIESPDTNFGGTRAVRIRLNLFAGNYDEVQRLLAMETGEVLIDNQFLYMPTDSMRGELYALTGREAEALAAYGRALAQLEAMIVLRPEDERLYSAKGIALAGLGRKDEAIAAARQGVDVLPISKEAWRGAYREQELARVYAMVGETELAAEKVEYLLSIPGELSEHWLKADPVWR